MVYADGISNIYSDLPFKYRYVIFVSICDTYVLTYSLNIDYRLKQELHVYVILTLQHFGDFEENNRLGKREIRKYKGSVN